jgi:hypothetical protein
MLRKPLNKSSVERIEHYFLHAFAGWHYFNTTAMRDLVTESGDYSEVIKGQRPIEL